MESDTTYFSWIDYTLFGVTLAISLLIGIYYGCFGSKQKTMDEYLHGGRQMKPFPIGMSLTASYVTGVVILGFPTEIYLYGTELTMSILPIFALVLTIVYIFFPVYHKVQLASCYEYLKLRFSPETRTLALCLYVFATLLHVPLVIYVPSLALNQVIGIDIYIISPLICIVCIFYTTLGGLKAVVLTDTIQLVITIVTIIIMMIVGTYKTNGITAIWNNAYDRDRIEFFNMSFDPTERQTFWGVTIGMYFTFIGQLGLNPSTIQRFLSLPTYKDVKIAAAVFAIGNALSKLVCIWIGLILFTTYMDCDPFLTGKLKRVDQLLPYYLLDSLGNLKGLSGLFVAGVCGIALSNMSTSINTLSLTIYEDFVKSRLPANISNNKINLLVKGIVIISGMLCFTFVFIIEKLGGVLQIAVSFYGVTHGPIIGMTTLGMLFPMANKHGAFWGGIISLLLTGVLVFGAQLYMIMGRLNYSPKPQSIRNCNSNVTSTMTPVIDAGKSPVIFQISFYYYTLISTVIAITVGLLISWLTKTKKDPVVHKDLLCPLLHRFLPDEDLSNQTFMYDTVKGALSKLNSMGGDDSVGKIIK